MSVDRYPGTDELVWIKAEGANATAAGHNYGTASGNWTVTDPGTTVLYNQAGAFGAANAVKFTDVGQASAILGTAGQINHTNAANITLLWRGNLDALTTTVLNIQIIHVDYALAAWALPYISIGIYLTPTTGDINAAVTISGTLHTYATSGTVSTGVDTVLTLTFDGSTLKCYKNKTNILTQSISGAIDYNGDVGKPFSGNPPADGGEGYLGTLSELRIFGNVKDSAWLTAYYDYVTPPAPSITTKFLRVNGIEVPCSPDFSVEPQRIGEGFTRSFNGTGRVNFQGIKQHARGKTTPMLQAEAWFLEQLLNGNFDHWTFDSADGLYSDKGQTYTSKTDTTTSNTGGKYSGRLVSTATTGTITYPTNLGSYWTIAFWTEVTGSGLFYHYTYTSDGNYWTNGASKTAGSLAFASVSSGSLTLTAGGASDRDFDELIVVPAVIPDSLVTDLYNWSANYAFPRAPRLACAGEFHPKSTLTALTMFGTAGANQNVPGARTSGSFADNLRALSFELMER